MRYDQWSYVFQLPFDIQDGIMKAVARNLKKKPANRVYDATLISAE